MATRAEIQAALDFYTKSGNQDAARKLKATLDAIPADSDGLPHDAPPPAQPSNGEQFVDGLTRLPKEAYGAAETVGTLATGMIAAPVAALGAGIAATAKQILSGEFQQSEGSERAIQDAAERAAAAVTYVPRTDAGKRNVQAIGEAVAPAEDALTALGPLAAEAPTIAQTARVAGQAARAGAEATGIPAAAGRAATAAGEAAQAGASRVASAGRAAIDALPPLPGRGEPPVPAAGARSAGAAEADPAVVRRANAEELGFKGDAALMKSQASQDPQGLGFITEQAKNEVRGAEIRARQQNQARVAESVFDKFVDDTGGAAPDFSGGGKVQLGRAVEKVLSESAAKQKNRVRAAYTKAEQQEGSLPSSGDTLAKYLTENENAQTNAPILTSVIKQAKKLGIIEEGAQGVLRGGTPEIKNLNELRNFISTNAGVAGGDAKHAPALKALIDERFATDGGPLYSQAIREHARFKSQYADASLINGIVKNKPGSPDRIIAADQILDRVLSPSTSVDEIKHMRRLMQTHGEEAGVQAWKDLQAGGIEYLRDLTYKRARPGEGGTMRPNGTQLNNAVNKLDQAGKLDALYGKKGAEQIRLFRDIIRSIENAGEANFTNNAGPIIEFLESIPFGAGKTVAAGRKLAASTSSLVRDSKLRARIKAELE